MWKFKSRGITLIEVMLAVTILCAGLILIARSYLSALRAIKTSQNLSVANWLLEQKIWERQKSYQERAKVILEDQEGAFEPPFEGFSYHSSFEKEDLPSEYTSNLYRNSLVVSWQEGKSKWSTSTLTYMRAQEQ